MSERNSQTTADYDVNIERWIALERLRLEEFVAFWRSGAAGNDMNGAPADAFPTHQPIEEWDEQYRCFGGA